MGNFGHGFDSATLKLSFVGVLSAGVWYLLGAGSWYTDQVQIGSHILLAFLAVVAIAQVRYHTERISSSSFILLYATFIFLAFLHFIAGILRMAVPSTVTREIPVDEVLEVLIIGVLAVVAIKTASYSSDMKKGRLIGFLIATVCVSIYAIVYFFILPGFTLDWSTMTWILGISTVVVYFLAGFQLARNDSIVKKVGLYRLITSYFLYLLSVFPIMLSTILSVDFAGLSVTLQAVALFFFNSSLLKPFEKRRVRRTTILGLLIFLLLIPSIPFIIAGQIVIRLPSFNFIEVGFFRMTHFSVGLIAFVVALLLYFNSLKRQDQNIYLTSLVFVSWSITEFFSAIFSIEEVLVTYGESLSPYIITGFFTVVILAQAMRTATSSLAKSISSRSWQLLSLYVVVFTAALFLGESIQSYAFGTVAGLNESAAGEVLIMILSFLAMIQISYLSYVVFEQSNYRLSINLVGICLLSFFIIPSILKALFDDWTPGFWSAEIFLLCSIALGPLLLGILYTNSLDREMTWREEADLYSDLLMHDISNYLQAILVSVELLSDSETEYIFRESATRSALEVIKRAENLILNVRKLSETRESGFKELESVNLLEIVNIAFKVSVLHSPYNHVSFTVHNPNWSIDVLADESLLFVFTNIIRNSIIYSDEERRIEVSFNRQVLDGHDFIVTNVIDYGKGINPIQREKILNSFGVKGARIGLGLAVAKRLVASYGGRIQIKSRVEEDYTKGTVVEVMLLDAETETQHSRK